MQGLPLEHTAFNYTYTSMAEIILAFLFGEERYELADGFPESVE